jgi:hypothetical protein
MTNNAMLTARLQALMNNSRNSRQQLEMVSKYGSQIGAVMLLSWLIRTLLTTTTTTNQNNTSKL